MYVYSMNLRSATKQSRDLNFANLRKKDWEMRKIDLPLSEMTLEEKLYVMETLWDDLTKDEKAFESPTWHKAILEERERALAEGKIGVSDWEEVKKRRRKKLS
jgi:putative addiction module component (TIGR02574 family)